MEYEIKTAVEKDVPEIINLLREFARFEKLENDFHITESDLTEVVFGEKAFVYLLIAISQDNIIGFALLYPKFASFRGERSLYLEDLYVRPEKRGKGLGLAMLKKAARIARENGFQRLDWQALNWNTPAIDFYHKIGAESDAGNTNFRVTGQNFENLAS